MGAVKNVAEQSQERRRRPVKSGSGRFNATRKRALDFDTLDWAVAAEIVRVCIEEGIVIQFKLTKSQDSLTAHLYDNGDTLDIYGDTFRSLVDQLYSALGWDTEESE